MGEAECCSPQLDEFFLSFDIAFFLHDFTQKEGKRIYEEWMMLVNAIGTSTIELDNFIGRVLLIVEKVLYECADTAGVDEERSRRIIETVRYNLNLPCNIDSSKKEKTGFINVNTLVEVTFQNLMQAAEQKILKQQRKLEMRMERETLRDININDNICSNGNRSAEEEEELQNVKRRVYRMTVKKMREVIKNHDIPIKKGYSFYLHTIFVAN